MHASLQIQTVEPFGSNQTIGYYAVGSDGNAFVMTTAVIAFGSAPDMLAALKTHAAGQFLTLWAETIDVADIRVYGGIN